MSQEVKAWTLETFFRKAYFAITSRGAQDGGRPVRLDKTGKLDDSLFVASDLLTLVKTVDGAGSGLDADLLDGSHASAFAAASHAHSGSDITSGTVAEARIDAAIARDSEVAAAYAALAGAAFTGPVSAETLKSATVVNGVSFGWIAPTSGSSISAGSAPAIGNNRLGFLMVINSTAGAIALFRISGLTSVLVSGTGGMSITAGTANSINVAVVSGNMSLQNSYAATQNVHCIFFTYSHATP